MQRGLLDGHITTDTLYITRKQYEAAKFATINFNITLYTYILGANEAAWDGLSGDTREAILKAVKKVQE